MNTDQLTLRAFDIRDAKVSATTLAKATDKPATVVRYSDVIPPHTPEFVAIACNGQKPNRPYNIVCVVHPDGTVKS